MAAGRESTDLEPNCTVSVEETWPVFILGALDGYGDEHYLDPLLINAHQEAARVYNNLQLKIHEAIGWEP